MSILKRKLHKMESIEYALQHMFPYEVANRCFKLIVSPSSHKNARFIKTLQANSIPELIELAKKQKYDVAVLPDYRTSFHSDSTAKKIPRKWEEVKESGIYYIDADCHQFGVLDSTKGEGIIQHILDQLPSYIRDALIYAGYTGGGVQLVFRANLVKDISRIESFRKQWYGLVRKYITSTEVDGIPFNLDECIAKKNSGIRLLGTFNPKRNLHTYITRINDSHTSAELDTVLQADHDRTVQANLAAKQAYQQRLRQDRIVADIPQMITDIQVQEKNKKLEIKDNTEIPDYIKNYNRKNTQNAKRNAIKADIHHQILSSPKISIIQLVKEFQLDYTYSSTGLNVRDPFRAPGDEDANRSCSAYAHDNRFYDHRSKKIYDYVQLYAKLTKKNYTQTLLALADELDVAADQVAVLRSMSGSGAANRIRQWQSTMQGATVLFVVRSLLFFAAKNGTEITERDVVDILQTQDTLGFFKSFYVENNINENYMKLDKALRYTIAGQNAIKKPEKCRKYLMWAGMDAIKDYTDDELRLFLKLIKFRRYAEQIVSAVSILLVLDFSEFWFAPPEQEFFIQHQQFSEEAA